MLKYVFSMLAMVNFAGVSLAQAAPFTSGMTLWLNANDTTSISKDGLNRVSAWNDLSLSGNNATQAVDNNKPIWNGSGTLNGRATVQFDGAVSALGDYMSLGTNNLFNMNGSSGFSFYAIAKIDSTTTSTYPSLLSARAGQTQQVQFFRTSRTEYQPFSIGSSESSRLRPATNTDFNNNWQMYGTFYNGAGKNTSANYAFGIDGKNQTLSASFNFGANTTATSYLGTSGDTTGVRTDQNWLGDMAEILVYNRLLNTAEQFITENYLSSKYDVDISAGGHDRYSGDTVWNSNFDADVFGIGRRDDGLNPGSVTVATGRAVTLEITSGLDNDDFLLAGFQNEEELSAAVVYLDGSNLDGDETITLTFDTSLLNLPDSYEELYLAFNASNPQNFARLDLDPTFNGTLVSFQLPSTFQDGFYTLLAVPEPSSLLLLCTGICLVRGRTRRSNC